MAVYLNLDGDSGVSSYEIGSDYIQVTFSTGATYLYNYTRPGRQAVEEMKRLAKAGRGLNEYINRSVRSNYASKS